MINPDIVYFLFIYKGFFFKLVTPDVSLHPSGERKDNSLQWLILKRLQLFLFFKLSCTTFLCKLLILFSLWGGRNLQTFFLCFQAIYLFDNKLISRCKMLWNVWNVLLHRCSLNLQYGCVRWGWTIVWRIIFAIYIWWRSSRTEERKWQVSCWLWCLNTCFPFISPQEGWVFLLLMKISELFAFIKPFLISGLIIFLASSH